MSERLAQSESAVGRPTPRPPAGRSALELELADLRTKSATLEEEVQSLRRRMQDAPKRVRTLEEKLLETKGQLQQAISQNERLTFTLREAREHIAALREEVDKLTQPPSAYGTFLAHNDDGTVDVFSGGPQDARRPPPRAGRRRPTPSWSAAPRSCSTSRSTWSWPAAGERSGDVVTLKELLEDGRADHRRPGRRGAGGRAGRQPGRGVKLRSGDSVLMDSRTGLLLEKLPRPEVEELVLEEVPGHLLRRRRAASTTRSRPSPTPSSSRSCTGTCSSSTSCPRRRGSCSTAHPGCGKTLIAKAVANSLAKKVAEVSGDRAARSYFLNIKGPELLNKYVGETERQIRLVFQRAREKSEEGVPVIVFFDEMDSLFRTRGTGISSDMESTIVPQLLAEIDGVETLRNVIVIGASNREDLIDPAILRPGRLDVKIKIERPNRDAAAQIFARYLTSDLPLDCRGDQSRRWRPGQGGAGR